MSLADLTKRRRLNPEDVLIWWTTQGDCESAVRAIGEYVNGKSMTLTRVPGGNTIPMYIQDNLNSREGRAGRGTVWGFEVDTTLNDTLKSRWDKTSDFHRFIQAYCGGVAFFATDVLPVMDTVGFVTDLNLNLILRETVQG